MCLSSHLSLGLSDVQLNTWPSTPPRRQEASSPTTGPALPSLKVQFGGLTDKAASLLTCTGNDSTSGARRLNFS